MNKILHRVYFQIYNDNILIYISLFDTDDRYVNTYEWDYFSNKLKNYYNQKPSASAVLKYLNKLGIKPIVV